MARILPVLLLVLAPALGHAENTAKSLARDCVTAATTSYQKTGAREIVAGGSVTCPAGDYVGFPPRARKHDRSSAITLSAGPGRVICPGTTPTVRVVSTNNGSRGNFTYSDNRGTVSLPISCRGASPGQGRRWFNAEVVAQSCPAITQEVTLELTLDCAAKLR